MDKSKILVGAAIAAVGSSVVVGVGSEIDTDTTPGQTCSQMIDNAGQFVSDGKECFLVFREMKKKEPSCRLQSSKGSDIKYQWSYSVSNRGIVLRELRVGAKIDFKCEE